MDGDAPLMPEGIEKVQIDKALQAIAQKKPAAETDFTLHIMEDGSEVSTMERVCKGTETNSPDSILLDGC